MNILIFVLGVGIAFVCCCIIYITPDEEDK